MVLPRLVLVSCVGLGVGSAVAEEPGFFDRLELRSHEKLAEVRRDGTLNAFTTDGCSGGLSATWKVVARTFPQFEDIHMEHPPWENCCVTHDRAYHLGGEDAAPMASFRARLAADRTLETCVAATADVRRTELRAQYDMTDSQIDMAYDLIAAAMFDAVRFGGGPCSGLPWRWGYGWPNCLISE